MNWYFIILTVTVTFFFMEFMAWFTHKFIMHGFLRILHKDRHYPTGNKLQLNDLFALMFAIPSIILIILGSISGDDLKLWIGIAIAAYGLAYFLLHDTLVHQRTPLLKNLINRYFRTVISAHLDHHSGKANYGFIIMFPWKYFREEYQQDRNFKY